MIRLLAFVALALSPLSAQARGYHHHYHSYSYSNDYYTNVSGHSVHRPMFSNLRPAGATARCADGSWSFSEHRRGTCSHHGGIGY